MEYDEIEVLLQPKKKNKTKSIVHKKVIKRFSFHELYKALDTVNELNFLINQKENFYSYLEEKYTEKFNHKK